MMGDREEVRLEREADEIPDVSRMDEETFRVWIESVEREFQRRMNDESILEFGP